jgi:hypothetical protein
MGMPQAPDGCTARTCHLLLAALMAGCALALLAATSTSVRAVQEPELEHLLTLAAARVETFGSSMANVVAQEDYQQVATDAPFVTRQTRSDIVVLDVGGSGWWVPFRDVYEVDGEPVKERDSRMSDLLATFSSDSLEQALAISNESARYNLNAFNVFVDRTINNPMATLMFLRAVNQQRSSFRLDGRGNVAGISCRMVSFTEQAKPSLIESIRGAVRGRFCIEAETGRVVRSELNAEAALGRDSRRSVRATVTVTYARNEHLNLWIPTEMVEFYEVTAEQVITGRATYSNFRQFGVSTSETPR